ncbi:MAG: C40 family peptidase [Clostridium sp.]|nr:C40 family peptidase [Clostridium sp.]MCM1550053.1 C40 family peptidase [Clostridium sp.]
MNIKKADDKPMVIHTKERSRLHIRGMPEAKVKKKNIPVMEHEVKTGRDGREISVDKTALKKTSGPQSRKRVMEGSLVSVGAKTALDQMEGGREVYESYMTARTLVRPVENAADAGRQLYRMQVVRAKEKQLKKVGAGKKIGKKAVKDGIKKAAKETGKATAQKAAKETTEITVKAAAATAGTAAGTAATGAGGILIGALAGEAAGIAMDDRDVKNSTRNRMIQFFISKLQQEDNQDSIGKVMKDILLIRFSMAAKYIIRYTGMALLGMLILVLLTAFPAIVIVTILYNSAYAIFFPSISSGATTQEVLSAYVAEFDREVDEELLNHPGYDTSEKIYIDYEGFGTPDNYCDILAVYMVKYGNGDTATDMTDKAKENLKSVFNDMCSYSITYRTDTGTDEEGNAVTTTVKEVNIRLKTWSDMLLPYDFCPEEQEMLAELMKPEYLALLGYAGGGNSGEKLSGEQYQAVVDSISDENGKQVVAFALSKVGYPYSQAYRDSGDYYDCSSLAYYAWQSAGVNMMYEGANTAAAEGKFCYDHGYLVHYDEMQPGDLIFYSYGKNGRFFNITHVAVYAGNGKVVEAANESLGVVYRPVQGKSSIVFIGRPR